MNFNILIENIRKKTQIAEKKQISSTQITFYLPEIIGVDFLLIIQILRGQDLFAKFGKLNNSISVQTFAPEFR